MMRTLFIFLFVCLSMQTHGQSLPYDQRNRVPRVIEEEYFCKLNDTTHCAVHIFKNGLYYMMLMCDSDAIDSEGQYVTDDRLLSIGEYSKSDNVITFIDNGSRLRMQAEVIKNKLKFKTAYDFLLGYTFLWSAPDHMASAPYEIPDPKYAAVLKSTTSEDNAKIKARPGKYTSARKRLYLSFNEDNTFSYHSGECLLLKGTWEQKENKLILHDTHFNYDFTMLVRGGRLQSAILVGDANPDGSIFIRE